MHATLDVPLVEPEVARMVADPDPDAGAVYTPLELMLPTPPESIDQVTAGAAPLISRRTDRPGMR